MTRLPKAPLIEVATQIRWGTAERGTNGEFLRYTFTPEEEKELPAVLAEALAAVGVQHHEPLARELEDVPFAVSQRYRADLEAWPVYQSGLGVFSIHVTHDDYDWDAYRTEVLRALNVLGSIVSTYYPDGVPFIGMELTYVDRFFLDEGERPDAFLRKKLALEYDVPEAFINAEFIERGMSAASLSFGVNLRNPIGELEVGIDYVDYAGRPAYIMDTRVRSLGTDIDYSTFGIGEWLDAAHIVQQHAFHTLIEPDYHRSFQ